MKLITRDTDYAIRALSCIAGSGKAMVSASDLVTELGIPRPFLRKILQALNKAGILKSSKGKGGGFSLEIGPGDITVFRLIEIFQGPFELNEHVFRGDVCPNLRICELKRKLDSIERDVVKELKAITIRSLIKKPL